MSEGQKNQGGQAAAGSFESSTISQSATQLVSNQLMNIEAFKGFDPATLAEIGKQCSSKVYNKDQNIISHEENSTSVFFVHSGLVRAKLYTPQGREITYQDLPEGEMFGEISAIDQLPRSTHVIALQESRIISLPGESFRQLLRDHPSFAEATMLKMAGVIRYLCDRSYEFGAIPVNTRIRAELLRIAKSANTENSNSVTITNMPKHQELANRLATHREAITREISSLEKSGVVEKMKSGLLIKDLETLEEMSK